MRLHHALYPALFALLSATALAQGGVTNLILDIGYTGSTPDGTVFNADPSPSLPSTGTCVFQPFVRLAARA